VASTLALVHAGGPAGLIGGESPSGAATERLDAPDDARLTAMWIMGSPCSARRGGASGRRGGM
jgi:hypothetical protein